MVRAKLDPLYQMWVYNPIGTGPWPDDEDTGDPPSTQPMGVSKSMRETAETKALKAAGYICDKCSEFNEYAEPNQADGTYICYRCR